MEGRVAMKQARPQSSDQFVRRLRALVDAGEYRDALTFAEQFSRAFLPQLSDEELNRVTGMMEGVDMIVDLQDWPARQSAEPSVAPAGRKPQQALPATRD
jgi:hypothetical protein